MLTGICFEDTPLVLDAVGLSVQTVVLAQTAVYARRIGVTQRAVIKRRDRILRDMKKYFEKFAA